MGFKRFLSHGIYYRGGIPIAFAIRSFDLFVRLIAIHLLERSYRVLCVGGNSEFPTIRRDLVCRDSEIAPTVCFV